jgi:hypothetical protein
LSHLLIVSCHGENGVIGRKWSTDMPSIRSVGVY